MSELLHNLHGDIGLHPATSAQEEIWNANLDKIAHSKEHVLQSSDVTGNRHVIRSTNTDIGRLIVDGLELVFCANQYTITHEGGDAEHGTQVVQSGLREVRHEMEHDPWTNELRAVID